LDLLRQGGILTLFSHSIISCSVVAIYNLQKITILVDNIPLSKQKVKIFFKKHDNLDIKGYMLPFHV
jgi:hypothetical protein